MSDTMKNSLEQQARDILERAGDEHAQKRTAGDVVEIANLLAEIKRSAVVANQQLMAEIERLRAELAFLHSQFQMHSPKMDGQHSWRFRNSGWPMTHAKGPTVEAAIQAAMAEVAREQQAAKGGQA